MRKGSFFVISIHLSQYINELLRKINRDRLLQGKKKFHLRNVASSTPSFLLNDLFSFYIYMRQRRYDPPNSYLGGFFFAISL